MASSRPRLHTFEKRGKKAATRVSNMLKDPDSVLSTLLLGNTLVNIAASALATEVMLDMFGSAGIAYATVGMTIAVLIFSEVLPKSIAARIPERFAMLVSLPINGLIHVLSPVNWLIGRLTRLLMRLFGFNHQQASLFGEEDLKGAIGMGLRHGILEKPEHRMLDSILELDELTVDEVMVHRSSIESLNADLPADKMLRQISASAHSRLPIWEDNPDNIIGTIHVKDFYRAYLAAQRKKQPFDIRQAMQAPYFVPEQAIVAEQLLAFRKRRKHMGLVVDEYGDLMGIITLEDILEEIVGEIEDEHDVVRTPFVRQDDGSIILSGAFPVRDANREFDWDLPDDDAVTLSGLIIEEIQRIPVVGERIDLHGMTFEILAKRRQAMTRIHVIPGEGQLDQLAGEEDT